jgi:hypothetical protein
MAGYLGLNFIVFVFHPLSGPFLSLSHFVLPAGVVGGRLIWYPRVAAFAQVARNEDVSMKKGEAIELGLQETVYEARVRNILKQTKAPFDQRNREDPVAGVVELSKAANAAVFSSIELQSDVKLRLDGLRSRIVNDGLPFTDAAMRYSEDSSARLNGDLGNVTVSGSPAWMSPIFSLSVKDVSETLNGSDAYWLLTKVSDIPRVYGIALKKKELPEIITKSAKNNRPWIFVW